MARKARPRFPRVAILIHTSNGWGLDLVSGICAYAHAHGPWRLFIEPRGIKESLHLPTGWSGDGVIARFAHPTLAREVLAAGLPAVNVSWSRNAPDGVPSVLADGLVGGKLGAQYFFNSGYRSLAYVGPDDRPDIAHDPLREGFVTEARRLGVRVTVFSASRRDAGTDWSTQREAMVQWLVERPLPLAVQTWSDACFVQLVHACEDAGLRIPDDVAILGAEQDPTMEQVTGLSLSSLDLGPRSIGYAAARCLHELMSGGRVPARTLVKPLGIIERASSDQIGVEDPAVRRAVSLLRRRLDEPPGLAVLASHVGLSPRALQLRFRIALGRTYTEELTRHRLEVAKRLLRDTTLSVADISHRVGYGSPEVLARNLRKNVGMSPSAFRSHQ